MEAGTKKPIVFHGNRTVSHFVQMLGTMDPYMSDHVGVFKRKRHPRESQETDGFRSYRAAIETIMLKPHRVALA